MKNLILALFLLCGVGTALAQNEDTYLTGTANGTEFRFKLLSDGTLGLVNNPNQKYTGTVNVPASITIDGTEYAVTALCGGNGEYSAGSDATAPFTSMTTENITAINLPEGLTYIAEGAFHTVPIQELHFPSSIEYIGPMFSMNEITNIVYPDKIDKVAKFTFNIFIKLQSVTFGKNVVELPSPTFVNCKQLRTIRFQTETPPVFIKDPFDQIGFWDLSVVTVYVPKGCIEAYKEALPDFEFTYAEYDEASVRDLGTEQEISVVAKDAGLQIKNVTEPARVEIFNLYGQLLHSGYTAADGYLPVALPKNSLYIIRVQNKSFKLKL